MNNWLQNHVDDIHVVCGCLKDFFRNLKEPLVTFALWHDFVKAAGTLSHSHSHFYMFNYMLTLYAQLETG